MIRDIYVTLDGWDKTREMTRVKIRLNDMFLDDIQTAPFWWNGMKLEGLGGPFEDVFTEKEWEMIEKRVRHLIN